MKVESKLITDFLERNRLMISGISDFPKDGSDGWKESMMDYIKDTLKHSDDFYNALVSIRTDKNEVKEKGGYYPEGSFEEKIYDLLIRIFKNVAIEYLFIPDQELKFRAENSIMEIKNSMYPAVFQKNFHTSMRIMDEAFDQIIPGRRKNEKQPELF